MTSRRFIVQLLIVVIVLFDARYLHAEEIEKTSDEKGDEAGDDEAEGDSTDVFPDSINYFTSKLLGNLMSNPKLTGNVMVSPFSVHSALAMLVNAAKGRTKKEIEKGLKIEDDKINDLNDNYKNIYKNIAGLKNDTKDLRLETANKAYLAKKPSEKYSKTLNSVFGSVPEMVDFKEEPEEKVMKLVNSFVEKATHNKIKKLIPKGVIKKTTAFLLINALYFKGTWEHEFDKKMTKKKPFHLNKKKKVTVQMMKQRKPTKLVYRKLDEYKAKVLRLPYKGGRVSMILILPQERFKLEEVGKNIEKLGLEKVFTEVDKAAEKNTTMTVRVTLPKFKSRKTLRLNRPMKDLGMERMFTNDAEFSVFENEKEQIKVSQILQKIFISVNEEGSEAAAATAAIATMFQSGPIIMDFNCDEPFIFMLRDELTKSLLFAGKVKDPTLKE